MLWLNSPNRVTGKRQGRYVLSAALKIGWWIVESTPAEPAARGARVRKRHSAAKQPPTACLPSRVSTSRRCCLLPPLQIPSLRCASGRHPCCTETRL